MDEEIINEDAVVRMKDPITKLRITDPVKNALCGHVYNKSSIIEYIRDCVQRRTYRQCPQPGCSNKRNIEERDLIAFPEFFEHAVLER